MQRSTPIELLISPERRGTGGAPAAQPTCSAPGPHPARPRWVLGSKCARIPRNALVLTVSFAVARIPGTRRSFVSPVKLRVAVAIPKSPSHNRRNAVHVIDARALPAWGGGYGLVLGVRVRVCAGSWNASAAFLLQSPLHPPPPSHPRPRRPPRDHHGGHLKEFHRGSAVFERRGAFHG